MPTKVSPQVMSDEAKTWEITRLIIDPATGVLPLSLQIARKETITRVVVQYLTGTLNLKLLVDGVSLAPYGTMAVGATKTAFTGSGAVSAGSSLSLDISSVTGTGTFAVTIWGVSDAT